MTDNNDRGEDNLSVDHNIVFEGNDRSSDLYIEPEKELLLRRIDRLETETDDLHEYFQSQMRKQNQTNEFLAYQLKKHLWDASQRQPSPEEVINKSIHIPITLGGGIGLIILGVILINSQPLLAPLLMGLGLFSIITFWKLKEKLGLSLAETL